MDENQPEEIQKIEQLEFKDIIVHAIADLKPYENNARTHDYQQLKQITASIREFGFTNPLLIRNMEVLAGHGRLEAADLLGLEKVPCIELNHLTDTQAAALVITDNKLALNAGWDYSLLSGELDRLMATDFDVEILGFDGAEVEEILNGWETGLDNDIPNDEPEDENKETCTIKVQCRELDKHDLENTILRAIAESGLEDVKIV